MHNQINSLVEDSLKISTPAWPLQNTVAVNPFWFLKHKAFESAIQEVSTAVQTPLMMPISFYQDKVRSGEISPISIQEAFDSAHKLWPNLPLTINQLIQNGIREEGTLPRFHSYAEWDDENKNWSSQVINEIGKYAAAYLDDKQTLTPFPWKKETFFAAWLKMQEFDKSMDIWGAKGFQALVAKFKEFDANQVISFIVGDLGLTEASQQIYLQRLNATVLGWSTQFRYLEWQKSLGYSINRQTTTNDLLAVRLVYDYALYQLAKERHSSKASDWLRSFESRSKTSESEGPSSTFQLQYVFQLAWELSYQKQIVQQLKSVKTPANQSPRVQMIFCIDVRSEMIRRHIETIDSTIQTIGFAGFFGLSVDFQQPDENQVGHRLPVLLKPSFSLKGRPQNSLFLDNSLSTGFLRNLRKNSLSSFAYVEFFGALYIQKMIDELRSNLTSKRDNYRAPKRFKNEEIDVSQNNLSTIDGRAALTEEKVLRAATILRHLGLTSGFSEQVWIVGHGSATKNNAFGSALDCGACGGHAGDMNARLLVDILNDPRIREGLRNEKIEIPQSTVFLAAIHETVTDEIFLLESERLTKASAKLLKEVQSVLRDASGRTRDERQLSRSNVLDSNAKRRSQNWSEIRPEWGLAQNACFIVAPRERTKGINLGSRSFLHDYDWRKDEKSGYQTLELIMTAPMVVTNWINFQYYASTVAPNIYGAGNKLLHNLTNEIGVVEGNGGDLRIGLPIQSIHDGHHFIHDPLRLTIFIEAPRDQIETLIQKHQVVRELVENEWLHLLHINPNNLNIMRRLRTGEYIAVNVDNQN